jgi:gamma-glutamylcyclotransferase (GGCT)/AIG2-like uncharacterized protein YtfP
MAEQATLTVITAGPTTGLDQQAVQMVVEQAALIAFLQHVNQLRRTAAAESTETLPTLENAAGMLFGCNSKLAVYGSLQPGGENHSVIEHLQGTWSTGFVRGTLFESGWGADIGYPAMRWVPDGSQIAVHLFESRKLESEWTRLDEFEGSEYIRILVPVEKHDKVFAVANIYALRE